MTKELSDEEIKNRICFITTRALLTTLDMIDPDPHKINDRSTLQKLTIMILRTYFCRMMVAFGGCTKFLTQDAKAYTCYDSASDVSKCICEECFRNSCHARHSFGPAVYTPKLIC
ncbi:hypothetical protein RF11_05231 [Thelohanellus kitauei]|uniref:UBR-type domain-containing protein n=1 Tax=Thelohanellus kitauei TaxID=669202 RepID=A0A0C2N4L6_THEKT|nr:hypothetical protein RF11_05231 [Thelohanellus kitauei]